MVRSLLGLESICKYNRGGRLESGEENNFSIGYGSLLLLIRKQFSVLWMPVIMSG